ncbi:hypothetical protein BC835DRAFT_1366235 [Cytidiella melzeri]|nr:hypothetical protein BC835DRAFT_1366235 [Cytidiella melzeri]
MLKDIAVIPIEREGQLKFRVLYSPAHPIRAGQGPPDPSTPQLRSKTALASGQSRARDVPPGPTSIPGQIPPTHTTQGYSSQIHHTQQGPPRYPQSQPLQDNVSRLHNVLGTSNQAPLPPLPLDATTQYSQADLPMGRPSYTPPAQPAQPTLTPKSMAPSLSKDTVLGRSHTVISTADNRQAPPKNGSGYSPGKIQGTQFSSNSSTFSSAHLNLSVYQTPGPAISAEIILPTGTTDLPDGSTQFVTVTQTTVKDLAARFPLNEDVLTSASSSTLAGTAHQQTASGSTPPQQRKDHVEQPRHTGNYMPDSMLSPNWAATPASQSKPLGSRNPYDENDVPIPIPAPRTTAWAQATVSAPIHQVQTSDPRGQKQTLPPLPITSASSQQSSRPQPTALQSRGPGVYGQPELAYGNHYATSRASQNTSMQAPVSIQASSSFHPSNNSPSRSLQQTIKGSPASGNNGPSLAAATPKHSPSQRLHARNGSTDTVQAAPVKSSPNHQAKSMQSNITNAQQPYVSSRTDTNSIRHTNVTLEYPDNGRYRSQTPAYPSTAPPQQSSYLPTQTSIPNNQPQSSTGHHARSMSQPVTQFQPDQYAQPPRPHAASVPSIATVAATAPSASAIVAAYRSGNYNSDSQNRSQDISSQRVPPRSAPSPAPTVTGKLNTTQPSLLARAGFATSSGPPQPPRGQTPSIQRPAGGPTPTISGTHSRTQSDSLYTAPPPRVPVAGHLSTPAPPKAQLALHPSPSELSLLKTPSSIAPSMAKSPVPPVRPPSSQASKPPKASSKKGIFGLFRSRSSPPKQDARAPPEPAAAPASIKPRQRSSSQTTITAVAASMRNIISPHPAPQQSTRAPPTRAATAAPPTSSKSVPAADSEKRAPQSAAPPVSIIAPTPVRPQAPGGDPSGRRSPGTKMFTPFRLMSKHHRTVSAASVEALDGTAANTVIGGESARSSTAGRLSPPLRDPFAATQDWRNREEEALRDRGTWRRRRPGVVFDVVEEFTDTETHHPARKLSRDRR